MEKASQLTGIKEKTALVRLGLEALIACESSKRLAKLGGTEDKMSSFPRRRSASSPSDVPSIKADIRTQEIVDIVREGRER